MPREKLTVKKRTVLGKKVKKLRKEGLIPSNIYGKKTPSLAVMVAQKDFSLVFKKAGKTGVVDLKVEEEKETRPVLIHNLQLHPVTHQVLHADFYQVDLKEKVKAKIAVVGKGEPLAVKENKGVLLQTLEEVEVEALPQDLLEHIEVDIGNLSKVDQAVLVKDLTVDKNRVTILTNQEEIVFKIGALLTKEAEEELKKEEAEKAAEAQAAAETAPAAEPTTPEASNEEKKEEEKPAQN